MKAKLIIPGRLPNMNEIVAVAQYNRFAYGHMKKKTQKYIIEQIYLSPLFKFSKPVKISFTWIEPNSRRDLDGIQAGSKFILDAFVTVGILKNDTRQWVRKLTHFFPDPDRKNPRIEIVIEEL